MLVYKVSFPNGKIYIGKTGQTIGYRKAQHYKHARTNDCLIFHRALLKYKGQEKWEIIEEVCNNNEAIAREIFYIKNLNSNNINFGYNMTPGGDGRIAGQLLTESWRDKIRKSTGSREVFVIRVSDGSFAGKYPSAANCSKNLGIHAGSIISICKKDSVSSGDYVAGYTIEDAKERLGWYNTPRKHSEETKDKIKKSNILSKSSLISRLGQSKARGMKPFHVFKIGGEYIKRFEAIFICGKELGICESNISFCLSGIKKYAKDYVFDYDYDACLGKSKSIVKTRKRWFIVEDKNGIEIKRFNSLKEGAQFFGYSNIEKMRDYLRRSKKDGLGRSYRYIE